MISHLLFGIFQLFLIIGGSLAIVLFVLDRIFPPMERTRDAREPRRGGDLPPTIAAATSPQLPPLLSRHYQRQAM